MISPKKYRVKNISSEIFTEPWTKITLKPGETSDELESHVAQRLITVYPYRTKLLDVKIKLSKDDDTEKEKEPENNKSSE